MMVYGGQVFGFDLLCSRSSCDCLLAPSDGLELVASACDPMQEIGLSAKVDLAKARCGQQRLHEHAYARGTAVWEQQKLCLADDLRWTL